MKNHRWLTAVFVFVISVLLFIMPVLAFPTPISLDGNWDDWVGTATFLDSDGVDDWNEPQPTDLTSFQVHVDDTEGVYLLMSVDDTVFDEQGIRMGITILSPNGTYYRIYALPRYDPPVLLPTQPFEYLNCGTDPNCKKPTVACDYDTGTTTIPLCSFPFGFDDDFVDPWPYPGSVRDIGDCSDAFISDTTKDTGWDSDDADCLTKDFAVEVLVPWSALGYTGGAVPLDNATMFTRYATYPSGPAVSVKDQPDLYNGIYCINIDGVYTCYPSSSTAIEGLTFSASSRALPVGLALSGLGLVLIGGVLLSVYLRRRASA